MSDITARIESEQISIEQKIRNVKAQFAAYQRAGDSDKAAQKEEELRTLGITKNELENEFKEITTKQVVADFGGIVPLLNNEQTFLLDYFIHNYDKLKLKSELKNIDVLKETTATFLNKIALPQEFEKLLEIRPIDKARLVPNVQLFKVFHEFDKELAHEEFKFNNFTNLSDLDIVSDSIFRGDGAGIKSIDVELNGKNQRLNYLVNVKLVLVFQDLNTLWQQKTSYDNSKMRYADLLSAPNKKNGKFYRIRMLLGYNGFEDTTLNSASFIFKRLLLNLNYIKHSLELKENGMCQIVVEYAGDLEKILLDPDCSNILGTTDFEKNLDNINKKTIDALEEASNKEIEKAENGWDYLATKAVFDKYLTEEREKQEDRELAETFPNRLDFLQKQLQNVPVYSTTLTADELLQYKAFLKDPTKSRPDVLYREPTQITNNPILGTILSAVGQVRTYNSLVAGAGIGDVPQLVQFNQETILKTKSVPFVLLGDLFEALLDSICDRIKVAHKRNFKLIFGHTVFYAPGTDNVVEVNLAKIPISLNKLTNFFAEKLFGKGMFVYTFLNFFEDIFKDFFRSMVQEYSQNKKPNSNGKKTFPTTLEVNYLQVYKKGESYSLVTEDNREDGDAIFIYGSISPTYASWNYEQHIMNRIPHFFFAGPDRGLAKTIKFSSTANPKTKVALYKLNEGGLVERNSLDNTQFGGNLTPEIFSVEITTVGFPYFYNGQVIFVDTAALGLENPEIAEQIMAGGYYLIYKTEHSITPTKFETKIVANLLLDNRSKEAVKNSTAQIITEDKLSDELKKIEETRSNPSK